MIIINNESNFVILSLLPTVITVISSSTASCYDIIFSTSDCCYPISSLYSNCYIIISFTSDCYSIIIFVPSSSS